MINTDCVLNHSEPCRLLCSKLFAICGWKLLKLWNQKLGQIWRVRKRGIKSCDQVTIRQERTCVQTDSGGDCRSVQQESQSTSTGGNNQNCMSSCLWRNIQRKVGAFKRPFADLCFYSLKFQGDWTALLDPLVSCSRPLTSLSLSLKAQLIAWTRTFQQLPKVVTCSVFEGKSQRAYSQNFWSCFLHGEGFGKIKEVVFMPAKTIKLQGIALALFPWFEHRLNPNANFFSHTKQKFEMKNGQTSVWARVTFDLQKRPELQSPIRPVCNSFVMHRFNRGTSSWELLADLSATSPSFFHMNLPAFSEVTSYVQIRWHTPVGVAITPHQWGVLRDITLRKNFLSLWRLNFVISVDFSGVYVSELWMHKKGIFPLLVPWWCTCWEFYVSTCLNWEILWVHFRTPVPFLLNSWKYFYGDLNEEMPLFFFAFKIKPLPTQNVLQSPKRESLASVVMCESGILTARLFLRVTSAGRDNRAIPNSQFSPLHLIA